MVQQATQKLYKTDKKKGSAQRVDLLIGEKIKELRKMKNLTQEDLAEKLGVSFQQIQKYENGKNRISFGRLYELSNFMKVPLSTFADNIENEELSNLPDKPPASDDNDRVSQKETDELLKIYYSIDDPKLRKNLLTFIKTMAKNLKE